MSQNNEQKQVRMPGPMGRGGHGRMAGEKPKNFKKSFKRLMGQLGPFKYVLAFAILCALVGVVVSAFSPMILGMVTTELYDGARNMAAGTGGFDWGRIKLILLILSATYIVSPLFRYIQNVTMVKVSQKIVYSMRKDISAKLDRLPLSYYDGRSRGDIMSRVTNDVDMISQSLQEGISQVLVALFTLIALLVMMLSINVWMTLAGLIVLPLSLVIAKSVVKRSQKYFLGNQRHLGEVNGHIEEMYGGHEVVKAFCREDESMVKFDEANGKLYADGWKSNFYSSIMMPLVGFAGNAGYVFVVVLGAIFASMGMLAVGEIQAFIQYMRRFNQPVNEVANIANVFQSTIAAAERVFELLDEPEEPADIPDAHVGPAAANDAQSVGASGEVGFNHVRFGYNPDKILIKDFNVQVPPGTKVAIVGPTGAGKTTLINLLMRFYDVTDGSITVDGVDVRDWNRDSLRNQFGMVLQDTWLFNGTIAQNISYGAGRPDLPIEEVREAARLACADHFIQTLPGGYDMVVGEEGGNMSQGERQLVTIARAIISDPRILILDEATSNVDTRTEVLIQQAMKNLMSGRTSFIIAHRLSTIRDADLILVLRDGDIVEQGTHESLLAAKGFYAELYNSQFASKAVS
ncbi:MAG: ABC transporter ATP-binding protein [Sphaerochaetaceae bacterium]|nr:ABC transporter ATP-binding protein [Sphaerochaetaceae bacterium]